MKYTPAKDWQFRGNLSFLALAIGLLCASAFGDTITTGIRKSDNPQTITGSYSAYLDNAWTGTYLGRFDLKNPDKSVSSWEAPAGHFLSGAELAAEVTKSNLLAGMPSAFVYNSGVFPLTGDVWSSVQTKTGANWIGVQGGAGMKNGNISHATGYYALQTTFNVDDTFNYLVGNAATDNRLIGIMLNGILLDEQYWQFQNPDAMGPEGSEFTDPSYEFWLTDSTKGLLNGQNVLTFLIANYAWGGDESHVLNPVGLALSASLTNKLPDWATPPPEAATPEPATLLICGLGIACLAAARRRRK